MQTPDTLPDVATAVRQVLAERGPMSEREIIAGLQEAGLDLGVDPAATIDEVMSRDDLDHVIALGKDRYARLDALLAGRTFTHRVRPDEVDLGYLDVSADLEPLFMLGDDPTYQRLVDGSPACDLMRGFDDAELAERGIPAGRPAQEVLLLDRDALRRTGLTARDLVGVSVRPDGFELAPVPEVGPTAEIAQLLASSLARLGAGEPVPLDEVVWQTCAEHADAFATPVAPLGELLDAAGLVRDRDLVGPPGFDIPAWRLQNRVEHLQEIHGIDDNEARAVLVIQELYDDSERLFDQVRDAIDAGHSTDDTEPAVADLVDQARPAAMDRDVLRSVLRFLDEPAVAAAVLVETVGAGREGAAALGAFTQALEPVANRPARQGLRWLRGKALDRMGQALAAESTYESVLEIGDFPLALFELARIASDRGDVERGLSLLRRAGAPADDDLVVLMEHFRPPQRSDLGRNDPCWCGSGRKYKACHRNREQQPLAERAAWLYQKAGIYLSEGPWRTDVLDVAEIRAEHSDQPLAVYEATQDALVVDTVLFEGGAFDAFLAERGVLLPEDERLLGEQWLLAQRSVWEIEDVTAGSGFRARDLRTGDRVDVRERTGSRSVKPGTLVCARFVPAGDTVQCFGGIEPVSLRERDLLLDLLDEEPSPEELVALLSARLAPPQLQNTEGEPLVFCETTLRTPDPDGLAAAFDATYQRDEPEPVWRENVTTHGMERLRATITLDGPELTVETNSESRMARVLGVLRELQAGIEVVKASSTPVQDMQEAMSRAPSRSADPATLDPDDPVIAKALEEFVRRHEQAWLDERIPALAGLTPREAADDPTRRPDLIRLLDSFGPGGPGQMDPARVRAALGL